MIEKITNPKTANLLFTNLLTILLLFFEEKVLDSLVGNKASVATRESFRKRLRNGDLDNNEIEIEVQNTSGGMQSFEIPGMPGGNVGMVNLGDILGKSMGNKKGKKKK